MIFHKYQIIWTGIPKNASSTIHTALRNPTDAHHNHNSLMEDYHSNDQEMMELYKNVAIVRNPYDRLISATWHSRRNDWENHKNLNINDVIENDIINVVRNHEHMNEIYTPQHRYICFGKKVLSDYIIRYENLETDYRDFAEEHNKTSTFKLPLRLPLVNQSGERTYWWEELKSISQDNLDLINKMYRLDFELFNYKVIEKVTQITKPE